MKDDAFGFDDLTNPKPADGSGDGGSTGGAGGMNLSPSGMPSEDLLKDLQGSIEKMQSQMQSKYKAKYNTSVIARSPVPYRTFSNTRNTSTVLCNYLFLSGVRR